MNTVELVWITPNADKQIGYMARVSNPEAKPEDDASKLIRYLIKHEHWSPFEMANMCLYIETTRDISRQILRHRSFHFQEFSQRYAVVVDAPAWREARLQDPTNRQNSIPTDDEGLIEDFECAQDHVWSVAMAEYQALIARGVAKEQARALLPEGLTGSRMYMNGTIRDWLFYTKLRTGHGTQQEHIKVAEQVKTILESELPNVCKAFFKEVGDDNRD